MTPKELAAKLDGIEYDRIERFNFRPAAQERIVVVAGASDDLMEFRGAIHDEIGAYGGADAYVDQEGLIPSFDSIDKDGPKAEKELAVYFRRKPLGALIKAIWDRDGIPWQFETGIPHATFDMMEDGDLFCRGIVFSLSDAASALQANI